jgi:hypothetical protein
MSVAVQELLVQSENGPELMYELAKNREAFERINKLTPLAAARELGKFEAQFKKANSNEKPEKKITKAPPPIAPVGKRATAVKKDIYDKDLSFADYERIREEQLRAR